MANIMLNEVCNLKCPYCFADEFVNKNPKEITMDDFKTALDFALSSGNNERIGLIGGEPTLHSRFKDILRLLIEDERVKHVVVFTNGTRTADFINEFCHPKVHLLINCNSPANMGSSSFASMVSNIDSMVTEHYLRDKITLGINMYKPDFDYEYILDLLIKYKMKSVRTSISVPNDLNYLADPLGYFKLMKPRMLEFFLKLKDNGITPFFDCNSMPECIWSKDERISDANLQDNAAVRYSILDSTVLCEPIIDILPDLQIIRCFGLSEYTKKSVHDFSNIEEARNYYRCSIDAFACSTCHSGKCTDCKERATGKCFGGCLCFKIDKIDQINHYCSSIMPSAS